MEKCKSTNMLDREKYRKEQKSLSYRKTKQANKQLTYYLFDKENGGPGDRREFFFLHQDNHNKCNTFKIWLIL